MKTVGRRRFLAGLAAVVAAGVAGIATAMRARQPETLLVEVDGGAFWDGEQVVPITHPMLFKIETNGGKGRIVAVSQHGIAARRVYKSGSGSVWSFR